MKHFILSLYPTTKLWVVAFVIISSMFIQGYLYQYAIFPVCLLIAIIAGKGGEFFSLFMKAIFTIIIFIFVIQGLFYPGTTVLFSWWIFTVNIEGIMYSLVLTSKIVAISSIIILFFRITKTKDFIYSLEKIGLPKKVTYVIMSTLQITPQMKELSNTIMDAQKSRGVETEGSLLIRAKSFLPILGPLVLSSVESSEERVLTLESRAFSAKVKKTNIYSIKKVKKDYWISTIFIILIVLLIVRSFVL
ncbi:energy-coupling factor transporter transmembrane protein EcfT [Listeria sp. FSL L7-0993]|uniref:energy-coupling factor transporter transmembrane component T n=1 Tax=Listeria cossartiae TaxID=2838249 RepID=UPI001624E9A0|nr:energy-coupling factor transporter transmembrane component T [Listeria cossartiae]MBC1806464.1 energy-coupling factor transporter transmembrane protein EcfT [Listeria cossartiae subsp. cayugensis]